MQVYNKTKFHLPDMSFRFDFCNLQCYSNYLIQESCSTAIHFTFQKKIHSAYATQQRVRSNAVKKLQT